MSTFVRLSDWDEQTLLRELNHRTNNELASAINTVCTAAVRAENPDVKVALVISAQTGA